MAPISSKYAHVKKRLSPIMKLYDGDMNYETSQLYGALINTVRNKFSIY